MKQTIQRILISWGAPEGFSPPIFDRPMRFRSRCETRRRHHLGSSESICLFRMMHYVLPAHQLSLRRTAPWGNSL